MKRAISTLVTAFALLAAVAAHADVRTPVSASERAAVRKAIRQDAKAFLGSRSSKLTRPSVRVWDIQRTAGGKLKANATIMAQGRAWPAPMLRRLGMFSASFRATPNGQGGYRTRSTGWNMIMRLYSPTTVVK